MKTYRNVVVAYIDNINKLEGDLKPAVAKRHDSLETKKLHQVHTFKQLWQFLSIENFRTTFWFMLLLFIGAALSVGGVFFALSPTIKAVQVHDVAIRFVKDDSIIVCFTEMATNNSERQLIRCSDQIALPKRQ